MKMTYKSTATHIKGNKHISIESQIVTNKTMAEKNINLWNRIGKIPRGRFPIWSYELLSVVK